MSAVKELRESVYEANMEIQRQGLVLYTFGNVSGIDRDKGLVAIKPSGVSYEDLNPENISVVDLENNVVEGDLRPSSDTKTHTVLYRSFPNIGGVVHSHSTYAVAWAQAMRPIPIFGTTHADHLTCDIPCTEVMTDEAVGRDYEEETGMQILKAFEDLSYEEVQMVIVACHGPFSWGTTPEKAVYNSVVMEELAKMALLTLQANPATPGLKEAIRNKHYQRKHGKDAYYGQD